MMNKNKHNSKASFQELPGRLIAPLPLFPIQPLLKRIVTHVSENRPELFARLGPHKTSCFLINPTNLPFVMVLCPDPEKPSLKAYRHPDEVHHDASISGSFLTLLNMVDGQLDGDALFFTRDLVVEGNVEAVVTLRNALDDLEGSIVDDIAQSCGPFSKPIQKIFGILRRVRGNY